MDKGILRTALVLMWVTILIAVFSFCGIKFYIAERNNSLKERDQHIVQMGKDCVHHVHNMSASADANLKDIYSVDARGGKSSVSDPEYVIWQATMQCLINYPFYSEQPNFTQFNTTTL